MRENYPIGQNGSSNSGLLFILLLIRSFILHSPSSTPHSMKTLFDEDVTASTDKDIGIVSTSIGFSLAFFLAMYKYEVGHKLKSMTITAGS